MPTAMENFNYGEDAHHQYLSIVDPNAIDCSHVRVIRIKQHNCKTCMDSTTFLEKTKVLKTQTNAVAGL